MQTFIFVKPRYIEDKVSHYILSDDSAGLSQFSLGLDNACCDIKNTTINLGGKIIFGVGYEICVAIPTDNLPDFLSLLRKYDFLDFMAGSGDSALEAYKALEFAQANNSRELVMYSFEVEDDLNTPILDEMEKALPDNHTYDHSIELPGIDLDHDKEKSESSSSSSDSESEAEKPSAKQKIIDVLTEIKHLAPQIAQIKESSPETFKAIKELVDSMIMLAENRIGD